MTTHDFAPGVQEAPEVVEEEDRNSDYKVSGDGDQRNTPSRQDGEDGEVDVFGTEMSEQDANEHGKSEEECNGKECDTDTNHRAQEGNDPLGRKIHNSVDDCYEECHESTGKTLVRSDFLDSLLHPFRDRLRDGLDSDGRAGHFELLGCGLGFGHRDPEGDVEEKAKATRKDEDGHNDADPNNVRAKVCSES